MPLARAGRVPGPAPYGDPVPTVSIVLVVVVPVAVAAVVCPNGLAGAFELRSREYDEARSPVDVSS